MYKQKLLAFSVFTTFSNTDVLKYSSRQLSSNSMSESFIEWIRILYAFGLNWDFILQFFIKHFKNNLWNWGKYDFYGKLHNCFVQCFRVIVEFLFLEVFINFEILWKLLHFLKFYVLSRSATLKGTRILSSWW